METYLRLELVLKALNMALRQRRFTGLIQHSNHAVPRCCACTN